MCPTNTFVSNYTCADCPAGKTSKAGSDASRGDTSCTGLPRRESQSVCVTLVASVICRCMSVSVCLMCLHACSLESLFSMVLKATLCGVDQFVSKHECKACASGKTLAAGSDASASDTSCQGVLCAANQRVADHACVPCPAGTTAEAGADAAESDTQCNATLCPANMYVSNHICSACAAGKMAAAGSDASNSDTSCAGKA